MNIETIGSAIGQREMRILDLFAGAELPEQTIDLVCRLIGHAALSKAMAARGAAYGTSYKRERDAEADTYRFAAAIAINTAVPVFDTQSVYVALRSVVDADTAHTS